MITHILIYSSFCCDRRDRLQSNTEKPPFHSLFGFSRRSYFCLCLDIDLSNPNMSSDDDDDEYRMYGKLLDPIQEGEFDRWHASVVPGFLLGFYKAYLTRAT